MALPPENRTPRMEMLETIVARIPREKLMDFPVLEPEDHQLIGAFIQEFNYMDFNLRRAIETFAHAKLLSKGAAKRYPNIHSSEVAIIVQDAVKAMDPAVEDNLLGHWAARRIPGEDAVVLLSKDENDAKRTGGRCLASGNIKQAVLDLADLRRVFEQIVPIEL